MLYPHHHGDGDAYVRREGRKDVRTEAQHEGGTARGMHCACT
jgi:hypothetical protein